MKKIFSIILFLLIPYVALGQYLKVSTYNQVDINQEFIKDTLSIDAYLKKASQFPIDCDSSAQLYFKKALNSAYKLKSQEQIAKVFFQKGSYFQKNYDYFEAIKNYNKAVPYFENVKDNKSLSKINFSLGEAYYFVYSEDIAFKYFLRALSLYKKDNNQIGIAYCYNGIGTIYSSISPTVGINYINKALQIFLKYKDNKGTATSYLNIANATKDVAQSILLYNKSIALLEKDDYNLVVNYNNLGDSYTSLQDYDKALSFFNKALVLSDKMNVKVLNALIYLNIADVKLKQQLYEEAILYSNSSLEYAKKNRDIQIQADNVLALSTIYEKMGNYPKALEFKNEYIATKERVLKYNDQKKIQLFQSLNELEKSQFEINKLKIKNENTFLKLESKKNITYLLIFLTLVLISLVVILFIKKKAKNKIYSLLEIKTKQISTLKDNVQVQNDYLKDVNNTKNKLFKIIAHDLKNPLSSIEAFTDLMLQKEIESTEEEKVVFLNLIKESATKASEILNDVLVWAIDQEKPLKNKKLSISKLINEELKLLEIQALQKEILIQNQVSLEIDVITDKNKVATVIRNLISNAIKFSFPKGVITISAELVGHFIKVTVKDNGIGMTTDEIQHLFIVDYKKSKLGTSNEEGTGLGLVLCKDFVQKLGGKISVFSEVNHGSSFSFTLPYSNDSVASE